MCCGPASCGQGTCYAVTLLVKHPTLHVSRQGLGDLLRHGQLQVLHDLGERFDVFGEPSVHCLFLRHSRHGLPRVVVAGVQHEVIRQREDLLVDRLVQRLSVPLRKIRSPTPAYEQGVTSEREPTLGQHKRQTSVCVPRRGADFQVEIAEFHHVTVVYLYIGFGFADGRDDALAGRDVLLQYTSSGHVIGVHVRVEGVTQVQAEVLDDLQVALGHLVDRVDDDCVFGLAVGQEVRVCVRVGVKELPEEKRVVAEAWPLRCDGADRPRADDRWIHASAFQRSRANSHELPAQR